MLVLQYNTNEEIERLCPWNYIHIRVKSQRKQPHNEHGRSSEQLSHGDCSKFLLTQLTHSVLTLTVLWREVKAASWRQLDLQPKSLPLFTSHSRRPRGKSPLHPGLSPSIHQVRVELSHTDKKGRLSSLVILIAIVLLLKLINTGRKLYISNYRPNEELTIRIVG